MSRVLMGVYEQLEAGREGRGITTLPVGADPACRTQVFTQTLSWSWCQQTHLDMDLYDLRRCQAEYHPDCEAVTTMMQRNRFFKVVSWLCWESAFSCQWIFFFKINYQKVSVQYFFKNQTNDNNSSYEVQMLMVLNCVETLRDVEGGVFIYGNAWPGVLTTMCWVNISLVLKLGMIYHLEWPKM